MLKVNQLAQDIADLSAWIEARAQSLEQELAGRYERIRNLLRADYTECEMEVEQRKVEALKEEIATLNESRQVLELKKALLRRLKDGTSDSE